MKYLLHILILLVSVSSGAQDRPSTGKQRMKAFAQHQALVARTPYKDLQWRNVGPDILSGRCTEVKGIPGNRNIIWAALATSGFWKTEDGGKSWRSLFDNQGTLSIGSFDVAATDTNIIILGTGESNIFRASLPGMGVYKSNDAGKTWKHMGLSGTGTISRVIIHPKNPNIIFVAASGNEWSHSKQRGLYKSTNGGKTWKRLLKQDPHGIIELVMHPTDPNTLYAASWNRVRRRWSDPTPEDGDHIWKSTDGGSTWTILTNGLPQTKFTGRIGLAIAPSNPNTLYALVDNHTPKREPRKDELDPYGRPIEVVPTGVQVYKSTDAGISFALAHSDKDSSLERFAGTYGWVFGQIRVDPTTDKNVFILGVPLAKSTDGGGSFKVMRRMPGSEQTHGDHHALWIDPTDPNYIINGNDGGVMVSTDGGNKWNNFFDVIPGAHFYNITYDMKQPYNIIGSVQDHGSYMASIKNTYGVKDTTILRWKAAPGGEGTIHAVDPTDPDIIYASSFYGRLERAEMRPGGKNAIIFPRKKDDEDIHRAEWLAYTLLSPHDHKTLYHGFQYLFKSTNRGDSWTRISPDLTYNNKDKMGRTPYAINHQAITAIDESPLQKGLLYVGTDDGRVWTTDNDGSNWTEIVKGLPKNVHVSRLAASRYDVNTVYITLSDRREDNIRPYIFRSKDRGRTWTSIAADLPPAPVNVVREDPKDPQLLFCGTDMGIYVSRDSGRSWQSLQNNLPASVSVNDLFIHPRDLNLVIATYGRGVWSMDDLGRLRH
jgi:photosystem II stability/assembly factor-like uncharacterized protein